MSAGRELHHFVTERNRFRIVQTILAHGDRLPTLYELAQFSEARSEAAVEEHVEDLVERDVVQRVRLPPEDRDPDYPDTFYGLTDFGWHFLVNHNLLDAGASEPDWGSVEVDDPEELARHEAAPRPVDSAVTMGSSPSPERPERHLEEYRMLVERANDALYMLDDGGRYALVNAAFESLTGYDRGDLVGESTATVLDPTALAERRDLVTDMRNDDEVTSKTWQTTFRRADGEEIPVEIKLSTVEYQDEFVGVIGAARNIAGRMRRRQELSVLSRVLRHNLGNKVNVIQGYAEVIEELTEEGTERHEYAGRIHTTADKLIAQSEKARDVHNILHDWPPDRRTVDITDRIWELATDVESEHPDVTISVSMPDTAWVRVADEIVMAIEELLENAIEHHDGAEPTIEVTVETPDEDRVLVRVDDDGPGIPKNEQKVLTTTEETPLSHSRGIGLWLVKWIVTASDGQLTFDASHLGGSSVQMAFARSEPPALTLRM